MKIITTPASEDWKELTTRPRMDQKELANLVHSIFEAVERDQDQALISYARQFDGLILEDLTVSRQEIEAAHAIVPDELKKAIATARANIEKFHQTQQLDESTTETSTGVQCWQKMLPIEKVGLYIPGGTASLFSTVLLLGIPAVLAECPEIVLCTPPDELGEINPAILYAADLLGIHQIYKVGGAQAIAAMAIGTPTVPAVHKIFGPGNQYVDMGKTMAQQMGVAVDMPAGPSEVLIVTDKTSNPVFVAADLLAQAEHGSDSQVFLVGNDRGILEEILREVSYQLEHLPRHTIATQSLANSLAVHFDSIEECFAFSNTYAPQHLIVASEYADEYIKYIKNAGAVYLGNYTAQSAADYLSGSNSILPTAGFTHTYSGLGLSSFQRSVTFQRIDKNGLQNLGKTAEILAAAEGLQGHKNAVSVRLKNLQK